MAKILVLDDEEGIRGLFEDALPFYGHSLKSFDEGQKMLDFLQKGGSFELAFLDINNENGKGAMEVVDELKKIAPNLKIIVMSSDIGHDAMVDLKKFGFDGSMEKPFRLATLQAIIKG